MATIATTWETITSSPMWCPTCNLPTGLHVVGAIQVADGVPLIVSRAECLDCGTLLD